MRHQLAFWNLWYQTVSVIFGSIFNLIRKTVDRFWKQFRITDWNGKTDLRSLIRIGTAKLESVIFRAVWSHGPMELSIYFHVLKPIIQCVKWNKTIQDTNKMKELEFFLHIIKLQSNNRSICCNFASEQNFLT